ncbi:Remodeling and spacing factor 1 [Strongyloides ratti]|uniref:Remodeling and spacing factor 1 n=1 Tax=Strongyloides ratti TaxID=34506 RepID=A0A090LK73_STRRB|nr:Remodeling and spacing factor 1 [Strongyloides ratti]CEF70113.1 Remodeling and spacing factor 1 [Strongyloides ratti]
MGEEGDVMKVDENTNTEVKKLVDKECNILKEEAMDVIESTNIVGEKVTKKDINEKLEDVAMKTEIKEDNMEIKVNLDNNVSKSKNNLVKDEKDFKKEFSSTSSTERSSSQPKTTNVDDEILNGEDDLFNILKPDPVTISEIYETPSFADIFVFYNTFSSILRLKPITFATIEKILTTFDEKGRVDKELINMQLTLIRRAGNPAAKSEKFEQAIFKLAQYYPILHSISEELEEVKHYSLLTIKSKLFLWKVMCLAQFDYNTKFKEAVANSLDYCEYSFKPMGFDKNGRRYFGIKDCDGDLRIFREDNFVKNEESGIFEECFDSDKGEWEVVVKNDNDLECLLKELKESLYIDKEGNSGGDNQDNNDENKFEFVKQLKKHCIFSDFITTQDIDQKKKVKLEKKAQRKHKKNQIDKEVTGEEVAEDEEGNGGESNENSKELRTRTSRRSTTKALSVEVEEVDNDESQEEEDEYISDDGDDDDDYKTSSCRKPGRRGRKKSQKKPRSKSTTPEVEEEAEDEEEGTDEEQEEEVKERKQANLESVCHICSTSKDQNLLLICDKCDNICIHLYCCKPRLYTIPEDDWFCPDCHHKDLVKKLEILYKELLERKEIKLKEEERKNKAAEALKRELALISVNLNGITPLALTRRAPLQKKNDDENSDDISDDDGTVRKSKKLAMKKVCRNTRKRSDFDLVPTIAEGRSRRSTRNVDYRFKDYDEQIDDLVGEVGEEEEEEENDTKEISKVGKRKKKDDDDDFELDEPSEGEEDDEEEDDEDMYVPPSGLRSSRRGIRSRRRSDEEFINDGSDSDYNPSSGKKKQRKSLPRRGPGRRRKNNYSSEEDEEELSNDGSTPEFKNKGSSRGRKRKTKNDSDFYDSDFEVTTTGRHVRKAAKVVYKEDSLSDDDSTNASKSGSRLSGKILPVGSLQRRRTNINDEDEFKPDDDDSQGYINTSSIPSSNIPVLIPRPSPRKLPQQDAGKNPLKLTMDVVCRPPPRRTNSSSPIESSQVSPAIVANTTIPSNTPTSSINGESTNKQQTIYITSPSHQPPVISSPRYQQMIVPQGTYIVQQPMIAHPQNIQVISSPYHSPASTVGTAGYAISQSPIVYQNSQNWAPPSWQPGLTQSNPQIVYQVNGAQGQMYSPMGQNSVVITNVPPETDRNNLISGALSSDLTNL